MRPGPYFFALGLAVGIGVASIFWWQKAGREINGAVGKAEAEVHEELSETRTNLLGCRERLRAAGLAWE